MISLLIVFIWTLLFIFTIYLLWKKVNAHIKVYMLIFLDLIYLSGVFYIFSFFLSKRGEKCIFWLMEFL